MKTAFFCFLIASFLMITANAQNRKPAKAKSSASRVEAQGLRVAPDLDADLARWRDVRMSFNSRGLSARERQMVEKLVEACQYINDIYWRQSDPKGLALYRELQGSANPLDRKVLRMLSINGSRFDLLQENKAFVGDQPMPPGHGLYPEGLTRDQVEQYVQQHPGKKNEIYSLYTVVEKRGDELVGVPYHQAFRMFVEPASKALRDAAALSDDPQFAKFLRARADALLSDDYYDSDLLWLELKDPKFDVIYAPYETYLDDLLGVKTSYGASVLIRNEAESKKLATYQQYVADIQDALPLASEDRPSVRGHLTPMEVMDAPFRAGDLRYGYQAVADNLPNDPRIHEAKGTKKIFFKNFMDARVNYVILPLAKRLMRADQASLASADGYMASTLMHEISHGLGPAFARTSGGRTDIRQAIGPAYSGLEEAKADVVGMYGLKWFVDKGVLPKQRLPEYYASYVAGIFRTVRFGTGEAHGRAEMMEFNFFSEQGAIVREQDGRYAVDMAKIPAVIEQVAKELLEQEATGDRARTEAWFKKYDVTPPELQEAFRKTTDIPVDVEPIFSWKDGVK
jgi:hypothetical protein